MAENGYSFSFSFFFSGGDTVLKFDSYLGCITLNILKSIELYNSTHNSGFQIEMRNPCVWRYRHGPRGWQIFLESKDGPRWEVCIEVWAGPVLEGCVWWSAVWTGLPGSAGSLGSADGDVAEASSRNLIQVALLACCCRGKMPKEGGECARW